jgi:hypothetical protein
MISSRVWVACLLLTGSLSCKDKTNEMETATDAMPGPSRTGVSKDDSVSRNKTTLGGMNLDALPRWTPAVQRQRYIAETEPDSTKCEGSTPDSACSLMVVNEWCPEARALLDKPEKDEFEARKRQQQALAARQKCLERIRAAVGPRPELAVLDITLEAEEYEFDNHRYLLEAKAAGGNSFVGTTWSSETFVLAPTNVTPKSCTANDGERGEVGLLILNDAAGPSVGPASTWEHGCFSEGCNALCASLSMPEQAAQTLKPRLSADDAFLAKAANGKPQDLSTLLRLQIVFRPGAYGEVAGRRCETTMSMSGGPPVTIDRPLRAFVGTGVGYRILDKQGVLIDWTPLGPAK